MFKCKKKHCIGISIILSIAIIICGYAVLRCADEK